MKLQTSDWSMAAGVRSSTMLVVTAMAVTSSSGVLAVMLARTAAVCAVSETSCYMDAGRYMDTHDDSVLYDVCTWLASQSRSAVILRPHPLKSAGSHSAVLSPPTHLRTTIPPKTPASP